MKSKLNRIFTVIAVLVFVACVVHVAIVYGFMRQPDNCYYAYPPEVAFLLIIPYAMAELVIMATWLIIRHVIRKRTTTTQLNDMTK